MNINVEIAEIRDGISQVHVLKDCDKDNINEWLLIDINDHGYNIFSDDELVYSLVEEGKTEGKEN